MVGLRTFPGERFDVAETLDGLGEGMPAGVRERVNAILQEVRDRTGAPILTLGGGSQGGAPTEGLTIPGGLPIPEGLSIPGGLPFLG